MGSDNSIYYNLLMYTMLVFLLFLLITVFTILTFVIVLASIKAIFFKRVNGLNMPKKHVYFVSIYIFDR